MTATTETKTGVGRVARVTGPVVDVEFPVEAMPELFNALHVDVNFDDGEEGGGKRLLTLEVAQHIGDNMVRAISMQPTDGLVRGAEVRDTGDVITLEPMPASERRIVHLALENEPGVRTESVGSGDRRQVEVLPEDEE